MERNYIAIQGFEGSFHHLAAVRYYGDSVQVKPCSSFGKLIEDTVSGNCSSGLMAIENSIAGSILPNYNLLHQSNLKITGEIYIQIDQHLIANKTVSLEDIKEVRSHPMALQQCLSYLSNFKWKLLETEDTALSAKHLAQHGSKHVAAIGSSLAASMYDLKILAQDIQTMKNNYTRFLILNRAEYADVKQQGKVLHNKASVYFETDHSRGSLARVLTDIANTGMNLSKLQSFPIPGSHFNYSFHADMEFDDIVQFEHALYKLEKTTTALKVYGTYKNGKWPDDDQ
jgi:prephenate dehydratase